MKYGIVHYNTPGDTVWEFLDFLAEAGFDGAELQVSDVWPEGEENPESRAEQVAQGLAERGLEASALAARNNFCVTTPEQHREQVERMRRVCGLAQILGTQMLRCEGGAPGEDPRPAEEWVDPIAACFAECLDFAEFPSMQYAIDNHGLITNAWPIQLRIFEQVPSPRLGANFDTMNYRWFGYAVEELPAIFAGIAPHTLHVHLKDGCNPRPEYRGTVLGAGEIDVELAVRLLLEAGYAGPWIAEYEEPAADKAPGCRACLAWMKRHCP
jgi:sugar phosphate isomerase/epimerase